MNANNNRYDNNNRESSKGSDAVTLGRQAEKAGTSAKAETPKTVGMPTITGTRATTLSCH